MSYNVQNLFDARDDGTEYPEFDPEGGWTEERAREKAERVGEVIAASVRGGPDILCLQEIENREALELLTRRELGRLGYTDAAVTEAAGSAVQVGVLSRYPIEAVKTHAVRLGFGRTARAPTSDRTHPHSLRPVLEVTVSAGSEPLHLIVNHWKSKSEGAAETEPARRAAAAVVARLIRSVQTSDPEAQIIVCGDLNEGPHEFEASGGDYLTALMPVGEPGPSELLYLTSDPARVGTKEGRVVLFSPWSAATAPGSYTYRDEWRRIDHILLSRAFFDEEGVEFSGFRVARPAFAATNNGRPIGSRRAGEPGGGYSDHFPVVLTLRPVDARPRAQ